MGLSIAKLGYSRNPWRIVRDGQEFSFELIYPRKRDAVPDLARLLAIGDWDRWREFTPEQVAQVHAVMRSTDAHKALAAVLKAQHEASVYPVAL